MLFFFSYCPSFGGDASHVFLRSFLAGLLSPNKVFWGFTMYILWLGNYLGVWVAGLFHLSGYWLNGVRVVSIWFISIVSIYWVLKINMSYKGEFFLNSNSVFISIISHGWMNRINGWFFWLVSV